MVLGQQEQNDKLIEEFGRQILVPGIDEAGQLNISKKKVCIIGLGALGTVASQYLVRVGVGEIHLIDHDKIEKSNLHRQINYDLNDIVRSISFCGKRKKNFLINDQNIYKLLNQNKIKPLYARSKSWIFSSINPNSSMKNLNP